MSKYILAIDATALSDYQRCPKYYDWSYAKHIEKDRSAAVRRGSYIHDLLCLWYRGKALKNTRERTMRAIQKYVRLFGKQLPETDFAICTQKVFEYYSFYQSERLEPIAAEMGFSKILYEDKDYLIVYEGRIDLICDMGDKVISWVDHKSEASINELNPDANQFFGYSWALNCKQGCINYIGLQKSYKPEESFRRTIVQHRNDEIQDWLTNTIRWCFRIINDRESGGWLKNRRSCKVWKEPLCQYHDLCRQTSENVINQLIKVDYRQKEKWSPW